MKRMSVGLVLGDLYGSGRADSQRADGCEERRVAELRG